MNNGDCYFIAMEWTETPQSLLAVLGAPPPVPQRMRLNGLINVHPAIYSMSMQAKHPGFVITFAMEVPVEIYNQLMGVIKESHGNGQQAETKIH